MKASIIASAAALFSSALAAPAISARQASGPLFFSFSLNDDITGANAARSVVVNAGPYRFGDLFSWAPNLIQNGRVVATSAQNINPGAVPNVLCIITDPATGNVFRINDQVTFAQIDNNPEAAIQTDVTEFTIQCEL